MKKAIVVCLIAIMSISMLPLGSNAEQGRGGFMGFIAGCCFGIRSGAAYNEGKGIHFREWALLIPFVGWVIAVWNGIDGANGVTTADLAKQYGAEYY